MTVRQVVTPDKGTPGWSRPVVWLFGIVGAIAAFLGLFILLAGENQYVGIGGDLSWRVGDISSAWTYGLLIGGGVLLLIALFMVFGRGGTPSGTRTPARGLADLLWHTGVFVVVNAFIWLQDIVTGGGLDYALWTTIPWGVGLILHAFAYYFGERKVQAQRETLAHEEQLKELQPH
jgi:hypothetical protein